MNEIQQACFSRISWGGVWAGLFVGLATQIVLASIGFGIALRSVDPGMAEPIRSLPMGVWVWSGLAWLFAAFLGGYVAAWMSGAYSRADGVFHGFVTWGLMMSAFVVLGIKAVGLLHGGIFGTLGQGLQDFTAAQTVSALDAASWWVFVSGILSLACAYYGGRIGARAAEHSHPVKEMYRAAS